MKNKGSYREQIQIQEDGIGFSYKSIFHRFLDEDITMIEINDPYIRAPHQVSKRTHT